MNDLPKPDRPALPRDAYRAHRIGDAGRDSNAIQPVIVTPDYGDPIGPPAKPALGSTPQPERRRQKKARAAARNPFEAYGERTSSRPYALRLPDAIDLVIRQIAAEQRTHPLRIVDQALHDHLKRIGRLPHNP